MKVAYSLYSASYNAAIVKLKEKKETSSHWRKALEALDEKVKSQFGYFFEKKLN